MFLNENSLSKTALHLDESEQAFWLDGEYIAFDDVDQFYQAFTEHYSYNVYQGKALQVELTFLSGRPPFKACVDTRHKADYARLYQVAQHLAVYRLGQLESDYRKGKTLSFTGVILYNCRVQS